MKKNKNIFLAALIGLFIFGGFILFARPGEKQDVASVSSLSQGVLQSEELAFDFGTVSMAGGNVTHIFKIKNTGVEPVVVSKMYTSCMCTIASLAVGGRRFGPYGMPGHGFIPSIDATIASGGGAEVEVVFDPAAHGPAGVGKIDRVVALENNSNTTLEIRISAYVTP